jgi:hypothetical protein
LIWVVVGSLCVSGDVVVRPWTHNCKVESLSLLA